MKYIFVAAALALTLAACSPKGPQCPAYNSVHTDKNYAYNPNNAKRAKEDNKKDIEKRKQAELSPKKYNRNKSYTLFPKGMR
jgi:predicted small lipoprotein YifL